VGREKKKKKDEAVNKKVKELNQDNTMKRPFMLAQVALKAYAAVFVLFIILLLFALLKSSSSTLSIGMFFFAVAFVGIIAGLLYVSKALSKGEFWAQVCAYIIFIGSGVLAVPLLIVCVADKEPTDDFWDIPALWTTIMLCIGIISLIF